MKRVFVIIAILLVVALGFYCGHRIYHKFMIIKSNYDVLLNSSQMQIAMKRDTFAVLTPLKVVCLGNSITKHAYLPEIEWFSDWGMAASKEDNDYCHVLQNILRKYNNESIVIPVNIADWERNPTCDIDSLLGDTCEHADVIVIRLGENVQNIVSFKENIQRLIDKCKSYTPHVLISGNFWINGEKEKVLLNAAYDNHLRFIPISWIGEIRRAYPKHGDTIYNVDGEQYIVTKDFILSHPNDEGMKSIAEAIFNAITCINF